MPTTKLDARNIRTLPPLGGARTDYRDPSLPGFFLRVSPSGHRTFGVVYTNATGKLRRLTIGSTPPLGLADARQIARLRMRESAAGSDPQQEKAERRQAEKRAGMAPRFRDICDAFVADQAASWRPSTRAGWLRYVEREIKPALADRRPEELTSRDVAAFRDRIATGVRRGTDKDGQPLWRRRPAPVSAQRAYEVLRRCLAWAVWKGYLPVSPCDAARPFERARRRRLTAHAKPYSNDQLRAIFQAARGTEIEHLIALIATTAARSHEARAARWEDFDLERRIWSVPPEATKTGEQTGQPHVVPLSDLAMRTLIATRETRLATGHPASPWVFPAPTTRCDGCGRGGHMDKPNKATASVKTAAEIPGRGLLHRFRDTIKTRLSEQGIESRVSEHILGHVVPGIAGIYDHAELLPQRRQALTWWGDELESILTRSPSGQAAAEVVRLRPAAPRP